MIKTKGLDTYSKIKLPVFFTISKRIYQLQINQLFNPRILREFFIIFRY